MLLTRISERKEAQGQAAEASTIWVDQLKRSLSRALPTIDRRTFLRRTGVGVGLGLSAGLIGSQLQLMKKADAADTPAPGSAGSKNVVTRRSVCTHCAVGCATDAMVENGVWVRQNPVFESPLNLGAHCAKGAALRDHGRGDHRLRYPMKLVDGKYQRISWDQALQEITDRLLEIRKESGPDALFVVGSSKHNNEQSYLLRKWVSLWGTNNCDHQARICHCRPICCASGCRCGAPITATTRRASVTPPRWPAWPTPGGTEP